MTVRNELKGLRLSRNESRQAIADALGITVTYYGMLEQGTRQPALDLAQRIAQYFGTTVDALFGPSARNDCAA